VDEEGDAVTLAEAHDLTFAHRREVLLVVSPTIRSLSRARDVQESTRTSLTRIASIDVVLAPYGPQFQ
jgi:hypothetical protein